jgi:uncharacterized membrane protein YdfJ with MMPL/SSD domain
MKPVAVMVAAGVGSWLAIAALLDARTRLELMSGMIGPLAGVAGSWVLVERTHRRNPRAVTAVMLVAFASKVVFFGVYVTVMLRVLSLRPVPFVTSFTAYFSGLYLMEALYLRRLFK